MSTRFTVDFAGPFISVQDAGRPGYMRFGVPASGPMDRAAFSILRAALERGQDFSALEVSIGGLSLSCKEGSVTAGFIGGDFNITLDGAAQPGWSVFTIEAGQVLTIRPGVWGSWGYLGFAGRIESPEWLGSHSMHLTSGLCGRTLSSGDTLSVEETQVRQDLRAAFPLPSLARGGGRVRIVTGPQEACFTEAALKALTSQPFKITQDYDRMGMRLEGPNLEAQDALSIPSEALPRGAVQVPGHGDPLVLLADHQTTGGYPKIATVISADQDALAQMRARDEVRFESVAVADAVAAARARHAAVESYIASLPDWRGTLEERLSRLNLISGVIAEAGD